MKVRTVVRVLPVLVLVLVPRPGLAQEEATPPAPPAPQQDQQSINDGDTAEGKDQDLEVRITAVIRHFQHGKLQAPGSTHEHQQNQ